MDLQVLQQQVALQEHQVQQVVPVKPELEEQVLHPVQVVPQVVRVQRVLLERQVKVRHQVQAVAQVPLV
jgi:hypothetical protein